MTESEWLSCTDPQVMLTFLRDGGRLTERKARLFACACCRRIWHLMTDERSRVAVEVAERSADGLGSPEWLREVWLAAVDAATEAHLTAMQLEMVEEAPWLAEAGAEAAAEAASARPARAAHSASRAAMNSNGHAADSVEEWRSQVNLIRDLFCRPFRSPATHARLAGDGVTVIRLAQAAYDERLLPAGHLDPVRLAVLADALEESGADDELVEHLRGPGPHVRGCWVTDLLLGKS